MNSYRVGQILYLLSNKNTRVFPSRVVEEIIRNTLNGKNVDYLIQLPDKDETIASLSELSVIPFSSIEGLRDHMINNAKAYAKEKVLVATGESERFNMVFEEYKKAKTITRERILLETMASVLPKVNKVIADKELGGNVLPFLPVGQTLNQLNK